MQIARPDNRKSAAAGRRRLDRLTTALASLAIHQPRLAFVFASAAGALRNRVTGRWPTRDEVIALFPDLNRGRAARLAASIAALEERNSVLVRSVGRAGLEAFRPLVTVPNALRTLGGPGIFVTFHIGAVQAIALPLESLSAPVLSFREGFLARARPPVEHQSSAGDPHQRAIALLKAHSILKRGGFVLMALDAAPGTTIMTECFGRRFELARGPFTLARKTGAPIIPLTVRWTPLGAEAFVDNPLTSEETPEDIDAYEQALAQSASHWLERYLTVSPRELSLGLLRELLYGRMR